MSRATRGLRPAPAAARFWRWRFSARATTLIPLGIGANPRLLATVAAGIIWVCAALATLLSLDRLFQADYDDGSLELIFIGPLPAEAIAFAKIPRIG